jgi:hypothetical protein
LFVASSGAGLVGINKVDEGCARIGTVTAFEVSGQQNLDARRVRISSSKEDSFLVALHVVA